MNTLIEQTVRFLSKSDSSFIHEKSLTPNEIEDLMDKGEEVADAISKDSKKTPEERETAKDVLDWIKDVRTTWEKEKSLHPNVVTKLMKITAIRQGKWGWSVPGGKVPKDFRNQ
jgi:glutamyl/glutaminyl-tRNA synthetase